MRPPVRPLVIILKRVWFDAIVHGEKRHEWRRHDHRFNARTCRVGRSVHLVVGYRRDRPEAFATIAGVEFKSSDNSPGAAAIYGAGVECIVIELADVKPIRARRSMIRSASATAVVVQAQR